MLKVYFVKFLTGFLFITFTSAVLGLNSEKSIVEAQSTQLAKIQALKKANKLKKNLNKQAIHAISESHQAQVLLKLGENKKAEKKLKRSLVKIEAARAHDPKAALMPISAKLDVMETNSTAKQVKERIRRVKTLISNGELQNARQLLDTLRSDVTLTTSYLPRGKYTNFIKTAIKEITNNNIEAASMNLYLADSSIITEVDVFPIPLLVAHEAVEEASQLHANKKDKHAMEMVAVARKQLKLAHNLGYAKYNGKAYKKIYKEINKVNSDLEYGDGQTLFSKIKKDILKIFVSSQKSDIQ